MDDLTGYRLDDYQLVRQLGRGAMAAVYLAEQQSLARRVALKVLSADLSNDPAYVERFQHEARAAASLIHPGIVQVYGVGVLEVDGADRHYLAQEYVPGGTLGRCVAKDGVLSPGRVLEVLWQVGSALSAAAERGLVHRDIKPDNLMLDRAGGVKVADFGLARIAESNQPRMTQAGVAMGTPLYMSPEQIEGREVDSRSDLYSLGVTAFQLLTGEPPFTGDTPLSVAVQHLNSAPPSVHKRRPEVPDALAAVIDRLLAKDPADRFGSPTELLETLVVVAGEAESAGWREPSSAIAQSAGLVAPWKPGEQDVQAIGQLTQAIRRRKSERRKRSRLVRRAAIGLVVGAVVGAILGNALARRSPLVSVNQRTEQYEDVRQQLFNAKMLDTPDAWRAVIDYHPEADPFYHRLALRGGALALLRRGYDDLAVRALERLPTDDNSMDPVVIAARVVAYSRTGQEKELRSACAALKALPPAERDSLGELVPSIEAEARVVLAAQN